MPAAYPEEFRRRAVDLVRESDESVSAVARRLGISGSGLRRWVAQAEIDEGQEKGGRNEERKEGKREGREKRGGRRERDLLSRAAAFFAQENVLPK